MFGRRLAWLLSLAAFAALPEALVRHSDPRIGFQAWMVLQLLGVIVAAIVVAAMFSSLGLALVRLFTLPVRDRPSIFVAWSFLKAARPGDPLSVRVGRAIAREVDGLQRDGSKPRLGLRALVGSLCIAAAAGLVVALQHGLVPTITGARIARNLVVAAGVHGFLLLCAALPWRRLRVAPVVLVGVVAALAVSLLSQLPVVARWVDGFGLSGALLVGVGLLAWAGTRPRRDRLNRSRLVGGVAVLAGVIAAVLGVVLGAPLGWTVGATIIAVGAYLLLSSQPKVTVPVFVSIVGVASGTWALIVVLSVMGGFAGDLREKMLVANAHALIERPGRAKPLANAAGLSAKLRSVSGVVSVSPQVRGDAIVSSPFNVNNFVSIRGVDTSLAEVQKQVGGTVVTGALSLLARPERMGQSDWRVRRPADLPSDLPAVPSATTAPAAATAAVDDGRDFDDEDIDVLLQLAPGPAAPPPPAPDLPPPPPIAHDAVILDSEGKAVRSQPSAEHHAPQPMDDELLDDVKLQAPGGVNLKPAMGTPSALDKQLDRQLGGAINSGNLDAALALPLLLDNDKDVDVPVAPGILLGVELARAL